MMTDEQVPKARPESSSADHANELRRMVCVGSNGVMDAQQESRTAKMSEFMVIHVMLGGPDISIVDERSRKWRFEDHPYCGPVVIGKNGDPLENQPAESSPFWGAVNCWYRQGKVTEQICGETFAKWVKPTIKKMIHLGGNHYMLDTSKQSTEAGG